MTLSSDADIVPVLSSPTPEVPGARSEQSDENPGPRLRWGATSLAAPPDCVPWVWHGYLARKALSLLTSQWKSGKTTLAALVLAAMKTGGEVAGRSVVSGRALVISEEPEEHWHRRARKLGIEDHIGWFCRPFRGRPSRDQWCKLLDQVAEAHRSRDLSLVVIDPLAAFMAGSENDAGTMLAMLTPLQDLASHGPGVLVLHHPNKGRVRSGQAARGSGALSGYADILIEMGGGVRAGSEDRRRRLRAFSRFEETPRHLAMELNSEGTAYQAVETAALTVPTGRREELIALLEQARTKLTAAAIHSLWPPGQVSDACTLRRWLDRAVAEGLVCRDGTGRRHDPFRYWLFGQEERWARDPLAGLRMPEDPGGGIDRLKNEK